MPNPDCPTNMLRIAIETDEDLPNPATEWDDTWTVVSFSRKHKAYRDPEAFFPLSIGLRRKIAVGTAFVLDYYDHSASVWSLSGTGPSCLWDSCSNAGLLLWENPPSAMGAKTYADREKDARAFLESYSDWANGRGLGYTVSDSSDVIDSCWGFFSSDSDLMIDGHILPTVADRFRKGGYASCDMVSDDEFESLIDDGEIEPSILYVVANEDTQGIIGWSRLQKAVRATQESEAAA